MFSAVRSPEDTNLCPLALPSPEVLSIMVCRPLVPLRSCQNDGVSSSRGPSPEPATSMRNGLNEHLRKSTKSHARKKPDGHIPRPRNAFIIFRTEFVKNGSVPLSIEMHHQNLSRIAGTVWKGMSEDDKRLWFARAAEEKARHSLLYPDYQFHPTDPYSLRNRRRVKKGRGEQELQIASRRCTKVANLLAKGAEGEALEKAILELEKHNPCVVQDAMRLGAKVQAATPMVTHCDPDIDIQLDETTTSERFTRSNPLDDTAVDVDDLHALLSTPVRPGPTPTPPTSTANVTANGTPPLAKAPVLPTRLPSFAVGFGGAPLPGPEKSVYQYALPSKVRGYGTAPVLPSIFSSSFTSMQPRRNDSNDARWAPRAPARPVFASRLRSESGNDSDQDYDSD